MKNRNRFNGSCAYCGRLVKAFQGTLVVVGSKAAPAHDHCVVEMHRESEPTPPGETGKGS